MLSRKPKFYRKKNQDDEIEGTRGTVSLHKRPQIGVIGYELPDVGQYLNQLPGVASFHDELVYPFD